MPEAKRRRQAASGRLGTYQEKRDFARTPEPRGAPDAAAAGLDGARRFVVQRHRARRLHYDLRFEIDGVLVSWAVPKGPTLDPEVKRTAVHVEDHPIEYLDFEGVIPRGEYGGGDVIVWDHGTWEPHATDNPAAAVASREQHADQHGDNLRGRHILVRRRQEERGQEQWLLLHKHDEHAVDGWDPEDHPRSVLSGRTNDEVKADPERVWRADLPPDQASVALRRPAPVVAAPTARAPRASGTSSFPTTRPAGCRAGTTRRPDRARPRPIWWSPSRRRWCGRPTSARSSGTPGRPGSR